jgi:16S rRNA processing protein RimM
MSLSEREIVIGKIVAPFGLRGEVKMLTLTEFPERFAVGREVMAKQSDGELKALRITESKPYKDGMILAFVDISNRVAAEELRGVQLVISEDELGSLSEGSYYLFQLLGLTVVADDGRELGVIEDVLQGGANDVYVTDGGLLIPAIRDVVKSVDLEGRRMVIWPMPGLLPEDKGSRKSDAN